MSMLATLLVGSPRGPRSTSDALGSYLLKHLEGHGIKTDKVYIHKSLSSEQGTNALLKATDDADLLILAAPLYADSHNAGVTRALELINAYRKGRPQVKRQRLVAISNSGFPEASQNDISLAISRRFALECGLEWAGGLALGGGESVGARPLEQVGGMVRNVRKSLELAARALASGEVVPDEAVRLMALPLVPKWLYVIMGNLGWRMQARQHGNRGGLKGKPYRSG